MSDNVEIKIDNKEVEEALLDVAKRCEDMKPLMKNIAGIMADSAEQNFANEGRPDKWQELSEKTIKNRKEKGHYPGKILQVEGQLAMSVTTQYDENSAVIGSNLAYARIHQLGGNAGKNKSVEIPARPYLNLTESEYKQVINKAEMFLT
jgi:phage virion morphogenesis protein